ncbi:MAG: hypothetical protein KGI37_05155 [Alphaproteobacteria bacterium]|nr:hypothetical protein [Alphaproteobacteria bacterium]
MKMVEFTRDMRPHRAGEKRVVPDVVADKLIADGKAKLCKSVFDKAQTQTAGEQSQPAAESPVKPVTGQSYKTRKRS